MGLKVKNLKSGYRQVPVVKDVSFELELGEIVALVGLNGAGKSTLLKTILGLLPIMDGEIAIEGVSLAQDHSAYSSQLAYIPETPVLYEELTLREHLEMTALGYDIPVEEIMKRAEPLLKLFRLEKQLDWYPAYFSKGMKQKVMVICGMVTDAKVLIVDEPFVGLDPLAIRDFTQLLKDKAEAGRSILFTTHVLGIAQEITDKYLMLHQGELVADGNLDQIRTKFNNPNASLDELYIQMAEGKIPTKVGGEVE